MKNDAKILFNYCSFIATTHYLDNIKLLLSLLYFLLSGFALQGSLDVAVEGGDRLLLSPLALVSSTCTLLQPAPATEQIRAVEPLACPVCDATVTSEYYIG